MNSSGKFFIESAIHYNRAGPERKNRRNVYKKGALAVEAPRFGKGSGAKEDSSPASRLILL
jgi:hypothetical protein